MFRIGKTASVSGLILFGTTTSLFAKIVYELKSSGLDGEEKLFQKPWCMTTVMFIGMTFCLPLAYWKSGMEHKGRKGTADDEQPLIPQDYPAKKQQWREVLLLAIPSAFDLVATILMNIGLLSVTASVYQMMRGAEMLFAAGFAVIFLNRELNKFHYLGILCCVAGISMVGISSLKSGEGSSTHPVSTESMLMGMGLIIMSQAVQAAQLTFEDFFMADLNMEPMKIVGFEGLFGTAMMVCLLLPIVYFVPGPEGLGLHENTLDTLHMIFHSKALATVLAVDMVALLAYNFCGMMVTGHLGAVFRTVLETMRTLFVWLVDLLLFYTPLGMGQLGESWSVYSYLQLAGFVVLVTGTLVYGKGDEEASKKELQEAVAAAIDVAADEAPQAPGADTSVTIPVPAPGPSRPVPMLMSSSLKATMTISVGSYSRSLSRSMTRQGGLSHTDD